MGHIREGRVGCANIRSVAAYSSGPQLGVMGSGQEQGFRFWSESAFTERDANSVSLLNLKLSITPGMD